MVARAMLSVAWILTAAPVMAASTTVLVDEVYRIPPNDWRWAPVDLKPTLVHAAFDAQPGSAPVRLSLLRRADLEQLHHRQSYDALAFTLTDFSGAFDYQVRDPGEYVIVIDNRGPASGPAVVRLRVAQAFPVATLLTPQRRLTVILLSFAIFFGIVTVSGRHLWRAIRR